MRSRRPEAPLPSRLSHLPPSAKAQAQWAWAHWGVAAWGFPQDRFPVSSPYPSDSTGFSFCCEPCSNAAPRASGSFSFPLCSPHRCSLATSGSWGSWDSRRFHWSCSLRETPSLQRSSSGKYQSTHGARAVVHVRRSDRRAVMERRRGIPGTIAESHLLAR